MNKPYVFVTRKIMQQALQRLSKRARLAVWERDTPPGRRALHDQLGRAEGLLTMLTDHIGREEIAAAPRLRVISNLAVGFDNIDLEAATAAGIAVGHTPGVLTETTADLAFALLMAVARRVVEAETYVRRGRWRSWGPQLMLGRDIFGQTLGIVGFGKIGRAMARRAQGFNMRVLYAAPVARPFQTLTDPDSGRDQAISGATRVSLRQLLKESDFVSLHVPLTPETRRMLGPRQFAAMKPGAILVNTARGGVLDQRALYAAIRSGHLGGAALDVTDPEPISRRDPLLELPNVVVTPHIGSASMKTRLRMAEIAVDNLVAALDGQLPHFCANPEVRRRQAAIS